MTGGRRPGPPTDPVDPRAPASPPTRSSPACSPALALVGALDHQPHSRSNEPVPRPDVVDGAPRRGRRRCRSMYRRRYPCGRLAAVLAGQLACEAGTCRRPQLAGRARRRLLARRPHRGAAADVRLRRRAGGRARRPCMVAGVADDEVDVVDAIAAVGLLTAGVRARRQPAAAAPPPRIARRSRRAGRARARPARPRAGRRGAQPHRPRAARHRRPLGQRDGDPGLGRPAQPGRRPDEADRDAGERRAHRAPDDGRAAPGARRAARSGRRGAGRCRCRRSPTCRRSSRAPAGCPVRLAVTGRPGARARRRRRVRVPHRPGGADERQPPRRAGRHRRRPGDVLGRRRRDRRRRRRARRVDAPHGDAGYGLIGMQERATAARRHVPGRTAARRRLVGSRRRSRSNRDSSRRATAAGRRATTLVS